MTDNHDEKNHPADRVEGSYTDEEQKDGTHAAEHHAGDEEGAFTDSEIPEPQTDDTATGS